MMINNKFTQAINIPEPILEHFFMADWPAPKQVKTLISTRYGGVSTGVYGSLNLGDHVGDDPNDVAQNRAIIQQKVPNPIAYLNQIHGTTIIEAKDSIVFPANADASLDRSGQVACAVMSADCLPVLFCDKQGTVVAAAHAGWRGLANGILQKTILKMNVPAENIMVYLGPAIGPEAFEVGQDVYDAFCLPLEQAKTAFTSIGEKKYLANIYQLARLILQKEKVHQIFGGTHCTVLERETFFSYRRDGTTGRMASIIWLENEN